LNRSAKGNFTVHSKAEKPTNAKEPSTTESENESNSNESTDEEEDEGSINDISDKKDAIDNSTPDELPAAKQTFISSPSVKFILFLIIFILGTTFCTSKIR